MSVFCPRRYGPWGLVAGGAVGLGAAFCCQLAARGLNLVIVDQLDRPLAELATTLATQYGVEVQTIVADLGTVDVLDTVRQETESLEIGLLVYNAAISRVGPFLDPSLEDQIQMLDVNCRGLLLLVHHFGAQMVARRRGGLVILSSMAGLEGHALVAGYAASKAYGLVLGESLWDEFRGHGVDVLSVCAGPTRTPGYEAVQPGRGGLSSALVMEPERVVAEALARLGTTPSTISGWTNRLTAAMVRHLLPRRLATRLMGRLMRSVYPNRVE